MKKLISLLCAALFVTAACVSGTAENGSAPHGADIPAIPERYEKPTKERGTVETFTYQSDGAEKTAYVYLPHGYQTDTRRYNILYFMHGGGGKADDLFNQSRNGRLALNNILDHAIADGTIEPLIVVTPTFYPPQNSDAGVSTAEKLVAQFPAEFERDLMPAVESHYRTYAASADKDALAQSRKHRAFGGFSMGAVTTWHEFAHALDYVAYFLPLSGDSWQYGQMGGQTKPDETAAFLAQAARTNTDFYIYAATGSKDIAYQPMSAQVAAMQKQGAFRFGSARSGGTISFNVLDGGEHSYEYCRRYIISGLQECF